MAGFSRIFLLALLAWTATSGALPVRAFAGCLGEGFKQAKWGMTFKELDEKIPGLREDFNRFEPDVTAYHSFEFPNNGFSEFRLFRGKLFYIRVKITSPEYNLQLKQSLQRCGSPVSTDSEGGADRFLWQDDKTSLALYIYPYYGELRAKSQKVAEEWVAFRKKGDDVDDFLETQIKSAFSDSELSMKEREQLRQLRKALEGDAMAPGAATTPAPGDSTAAPAPSRSLDSTESWGRGIQPQGQGSSAPSSPPPATAKPQAPPPPAAQSPSSEEPKKEDPTFQGMEDFLQ